MGILATAGGVSVCSEPQRWRLQGLHDPGHHTAGAGHRRLPRRQHSGLRIPQGDIHL